MTDPRDIEIQSLPARTTQLGSLQILRALPRRQRRMVGPWCFLDRYGPLHFDAGKPMDVAPHPHIGLQTVSWLLEGEVIHHDSLGFEALIRPGQLNLMTSGFGIAHSEETPRTHSGQLSGVQLWVALPERHRNIAPAFEHYADLPVLDLGPCTATLIAGHHLTYSSPATTYSEMLGMEIHFQNNGSVTLPLNAEFEHALFPLEGQVAIHKQALAAEALHYVPPGNPELPLKGDSGARVLLIGGKPFGESIVMWWNFVARTYEEIAHAREDWMQHQRFGEVRAYNGPRLDAPPLAQFAPANPAS